jgi:hypothetical protein
MYAIMDEQVEREDDEHVEPAPIVKKQQNTHSNFNV